MMRKPTLLEVLKNLGWLVVVALPSFFILVWVQGLITGTAGSRDLRSALETGAFYYPLSALWVALGGLAYQVLVVFLLPTSWTLLQRRVVAVLLTPVIPLPLILLGESITEFLLPVLLALVLYGLLIRLPGDRAEKAG